MMKNLSRAMVLVVAAMLSAAALAQEYPVRDIRSICNFPPGSGADILVRYFSDRLAKLTERSVIVENKAGAQGNIATDVVAKAKPDGYTIMITPASSTLAAAPHLFKQLPFDPIKDFAPVATIAKLTFVVTVDATKPIRSIAELNQYLKGSLVPPTIPAWCRGRSCAIQADSRPPMCRTKS